MKKLVIFLLTFTFASAGVADIQAPPGGEFNRIRKLGRSISNILYGVTELPASMTRVRDTEGRNAAWSYGLVKGIQKTTMRFGYGLYELVTFPLPAYKEGYRPMISPHDSHDPTVSGYTEITPELGFRSYTVHSRSQSF
jgi:putative exosortase-associated protein (TIGR04073 family)